METNSLLDLSPSQLRKAADLKERIDALTSELASLLGGDSTLNPQPLRPKSGRRNMSPEGQERIAAAARARWAKVRAAKGGTSKNGSANNTSPAPLKDKRIMSAVAKAKISAAAKARWAKIKNTKR